MSESVATTNGSNDGIASLTKPTKALVTPTDKGFTVDINADNGSTVDLDMSSQFVTEPELASQISNLKSQLASEQAKRQQIEDERANHRNLNRMLTLMGALIISVVVTYILNHPGLLLSAHACKKYGPYSFAITILMDSSLAMYSFIKRY